MLTNFLRNHLNAFVNISTILPLGNLSIVASICTDQRKCCYSKMMTSSNKIKKKLNKKRNSISVEKNTRTRKTSCNYAANRKHSTIHEVSKCYTCFCRLLFFVAVLLERCFSVLCFLFYFGRNKLTTTHLHPTNIFHW